MVTTSIDGQSWQTPQVVFPTYALEGGGCAVMHQRMGFYIAPQDRLLLVAFYGISPDHLTFPNNGKGIGRVVREAYRDGTFGPIYFLRYNPHAGWSEENTNLPFYRTSPDQGFIDACDALLADKLMTQQWWEEDRSEDGFFTISGQKAFTSYHH